MRRGARDPGLRPPAPHVQSLRARHQGALNFLSWSCCCGAASAYSVMLGMPWLGVGSSSSLKDSHTHSQHAHLTAAAWPLTQSAWRGLIAMTSLAALLALVGSALIMLPLPEQGSLGSDSAPHSKSGPLAMLRLVSTFYTGITKAEQLRVEEANTRLKMLLHGTESQEASQGMARTRSFRETRGGTGGNLVREGVAAVGEETAGELRLRSAEPAGEVALQGTAAYATQEAERKAGGTSSQAKGRAEALGFQVRKTGRAALQHQQEPGSSQETQDQEGDVQRATRVVRQHQWRRMIEPGAPWLDERGEPIQAHGGGMLFVPERGRYYWYGENKGGETYLLARGSLARVDVIGISCYSSTDLVHWHNHGVVLAANGSHPSHDLHPSKVVERPKVIYNAQTKRYVMWLHVDDAEYKLASTGVALAEQPEGPFTYVRRFRPHNFDSRDFTIFQDADDDDTGAGRPLSNVAAPAYLLYSSESNSVLHVSRLSDDYLDVAGGFVKRLVDEWREAPAVFKWNGFYFIVTSGCTGWKPNGALVHMASSIMGEWVSLGDPCLGGPRGFSKVTFKSQGTFVMPVKRRSLLRTRAEARANTTLALVSTGSSASTTAARLGEPQGSSEVEASLFLFMADRWNEKDLQSSRYVWLPLIVEAPEKRSTGGGNTEGAENGRPKVRVIWQDKWTLPEKWL